MFCKQLYSFISVLLITGVPAVTAQTARISAPPVVQELLDTWKRENIQSGTLPGWRVQILAATDRQEVERTKTAFLTQFPDIPANWTHEKPYYKLRVGAFRSRLEARAFIDFIQELFPGSYPAKDPAIQPQDFIQTRF
jgi:hypothetical protein